MACVGAVSVNHEKSVIDEARNHLSDGAMVGTWHVRNRTGPSTGPFSKATQSTRQSSVYTLQLQRTGCSVKCGSEGCECVTRLDACDGCVLRGELRAHGAHTAAWSPGDLWVANRAPEVDGTHASMASPHATHSTPRERQGSHRARRSYTAAVLTTGGGADGWAASGVLSGLARLPFNGMLAHQSNTILVACFIGAPPPEKAPYLETAQGYRSVRRVCAYGVVLVRLRRGPARQLGPRSSWGQGQGLGPRARFATHILCSFFLTAEPKRSRASGTGWPASRSTFCSAPASGFSNCGEPVKSV